MPEICHLENREIAISQRNLMKFGTQQYIWNSMTAKSPNEHF